MTITFSDTGNLAEAPVLKTVLVDGEPRPVAEMRIRFDRPVPVEDGYEDKGGFWLPVNLWRRAEAAASVLPKGARVYVQGVLVQETWKDRDTGGERSKFKLNAEYIALDLARVDSIALRPSLAQAAEAAGEGAGAS